MNEQSTNEILEQIECLQNIQKQSDPKSGRWTVCGDLLTPLFEEMKKRAST